MSESARELELSRYFSRKKRKEVNEIEREKVGWLLKERKGALTA